MKLYYRKDIRMDTIVIILNFHKLNKSVDIEVPLNISAKELVFALNSAYKLNIDTEDISKCYLKSENPIAFLKGNKTLREYKLRDGSIINIF